MDMEYYPPIDYNDPASDQSSPYDLFSTPSAQNNNRFQFPHNSFPDYNYLQFPPPKEYPPPPSIFHHQDQHEYTFQPPPPIQPFPSRYSQYGDPPPPPLYSNPSSRIPSIVDDQLARVNGLSMRPPSIIGRPDIERTDLQTFMRPYMEQYVRTPNRLAFGERTIIVMSSKVAQKSYGTEKRFLCPPPTAILIGNSWWTSSPSSSSSPSHESENKLVPPRIVVSISGEPTPSEGSIEWTGSSGKSFDVADPPTGTTYIGRCVGKQLFISDVDEKKKKVEALVRVTSTAWVDDGSGVGREEERVIGTFSSRPIKVISKPSKKRQSAKNLELCINHGSTVSLFHRLRSQTVSTKYLCVSGSGSSFKGSDGAPLMGLDQRMRAGTPSFIARTASWDPFILYIVDPLLPPSHSHHGSDPPPPPPPPQPEYPSPPPNAIAFTNNGSQIPVYYNQTVVLQCLTSGVVSPVLIIRKVDHQTTVVGGGPVSPGAPTPTNTRPANGSSAVGPADQYCPPGEVCGDPVSQLHKVAFEVYDASRHGKQAQQPQGSLGETGAFLSCMGEKVNTYRPVEGRQWNLGGAAAVTPSATPTSEYFGQSHSSSGSAPASPSSNDGGKVKKKRSTNSAGASSAKGRRRPSSAGSSNGSSGANGNSISGNGAIWSVDIGETSVWTIVGTDQVRYNFYVPPVLFDAQHAPSTGSFPVPSKSVTPFPAVVKYLPPDRASELPKHHHNANNSSVANRMLTLYGENFSKSESLMVWFGHEASDYVEVRCTEVVGCSPPVLPTDPLSGKRRTISLVRSDGVVFPSNVLYP